MWRWDYNPNPTKFSTHLTMIYPEDELANAHKASMHNKATLAFSENAGCFYCLAVVPVKRVVKYVDNGGTGICPLCGVDSLLPSSIVAQAKNPSFLSQMHDRWFLVDRGD